MRLLNNEESWHLLCHKVFAEKRYPPELEKVGKEIAENCEGLPLLILMVADLLSKGNKTPEYWNKVAKKKNSLFMNAHNKISKALHPRYKSLPQYLKACFLYIGVFPQNDKIHRSRIINMWIAEGFLATHHSQPIEDFAINCLLELVDQSLVMVIQEDSNSKAKTCSLHSVFWHLCNSEATKSKFFHALDTCADNCEEGMKNQCRLCIRNSILFGVKNVCDSMSSISTAHSLLCTGPPHQYPVPIWLDLRLRRVMDALTIYLYEFPTEIVKLIHLRYLALTCNGKIPASISELWNLQFFIVGRHQSIKSSEDSLYLPVEIWDMKELKHLQITGRRLPDPNDSTLLPNLLILLDVSAHNCSERVLKRMPNLKTLGIQIELAPDDDGTPLWCLSHTLHLPKLESLKCVVVIPKLIVDPPTGISISTSGLRKLSLNGLGYPWEYMSIIGKLKNLEVLKLQCYAFRGPEWETGYDDFMRLKFLLIEDTDLVCWKLRLPSFEDLEYLSIKHCYKLEKLPNLLPFTLQTVEIVDCNPLIGTTWAKQMEENCSWEFRRFHVQSSWDADSLRQ